MNFKRIFVALFAFALLAGACGTDEDSGTDPGDVVEETPSETPAEAPSETPTETPSEGAMGPAFSDEGRTLDAPMATIDVDGDTADWAGIEGLDMTLYPISDESFDPKDSTLKVAYDSNYVYALVTVDDDYNWDPDNHNLSAALAVQWAIDPGAGEAMGSTDEDRETSLGMVDIWHWELACTAGTDNGGAVSGPGDGKDPGDDGGCGFDDEYASSTEDREDDGGAGAENSLFGVWTHSEMTADADGTWVFEMQRPLDTGDAQDAQFEAGSSAQVATAYWDADSGDGGWDDEDHVQSANQGWITVNFVGDAPAGSGDGAMGPSFSDEGRTLDAPMATIDVDGDAADWADIDGLDMTLYPISDESFDPKDSTLKVAYDNDYVYALMTVDDDYDWNADDNKLSAAMAVQWAIDTGAGEAMGATDEDRETSLGMVDIWHWELNCAAGVDTGGSVSGPGDGKDPGDDGGCNFDDEYASDTETREDDDGASAENSLFGVWTHSAMTADADGTWVFEMQRPLDTGDGQDAQFEAGSSALVATAYWDADSGPDGWKDEFHVQSANQGWITVNFV